jgi:hypothetical protein
MFIGLLVLYNKTEHFVRNFRAIMREMHVMLPVELYMRHALCRMIIHGGWVPVVGEDGTLALSEKEWVCSNSLGIFDLGLL